MPTGPQRPRPKMSEASRLKGAVTRASRAINRIDMEYGAANIPLDHPLYAKRAGYKEKHQAALKALREHTTGPGQDAVDVSNRAISLWESMPPNKR